MIQYIYFVKCPNCEDEHFDLFDEAKGFAMGCLSKKPIITQTEVNRNDFGECTDHCDLGTVWSWEDAVGKETEEPGTNIFSKGDFGEYNPDNDSEFVDDEDEDFRLLNGLEEAVTFGISFKNSEDMAEFKKLCDEIGIITMGDIKKFMQENNADSSNVLDKLRVYRAELGPDFKIKEAYTDPETECIYNDNIECTNNEDCTDCPNNPKAVLRKPVPEGMTIEQLVETMEENEDEVECAVCQELFNKEDCIRKEGFGWLCDDCADNVVKCTWCDDIFDRSECRYEVNLGWLCDRCEAAIKSRGETLTFKENNYWDFLDEKFDIDFDDEASSDMIDVASDASKEQLPDSKITESFDYNKKVDFEYDDLTITVYGRQRDADDWDEWEHTGSYTYQVEQGDVANAIWENFITEEDVKDVEGGLETLEDNDAWYAFLDIHFDTLLDKYYDKLRDYYEDDAKDEYQDNYEDDNDYYDYED